MAKTFRWQKPNDTWSDSGTLSQMMGAAVARVPNGEFPYRLAVNGKPKRKGLRRWVLFGLRREAGRSDVGDVLRVWGKDEVLFVARAVRPALEVIDTNGNDKADVFWSAVLQQFRNSVDHWAGAYVCKANSQHRFGNAVDIFFKSFTAQEQVAAWAVAHADEYHIEHVISGDRIWSRGQGWHDYDGEYHSHLHVDFSPNFDTSLPCGVRG